VVDRLKRSLDELDPPICPTCNIEMKWTRSALAGPNLINHVFHCPNCHKLGESVVEVEEVSVPPSKLSAPRRRAA